MPLVIYSLGGRHTHTHTRTHTCTHTHTYTGGVKVISRNQARASHTPGLKIENLNGEWELRDSLVF